MQIILSRFLLQIMLVLDCKTKSFQPIVYRTKDNFAEVDKKNRSVGRNVKMVGLFHDR